MKQNASYLSKKGGRSLVARGSSRINEQNKSAEIATEWLGTANNTDNRTIESVSRLAKFPNRAVIELPIVCYTRYSAHTFLECLTVNRAVFFQR
jgi:hypothetical protein